MGASLFEVLFYPNLLTALMVMWFARRDFAKIINMPWKINLVFAASVTVIIIGQAAPLFLQVPVTMVVLLMYLQPIWTILIVTFWFKKHQSRRSWMLVGLMTVGLILLLNPFEDLAFSLPGILMALLAGVGLSVWVVTTQYYSRQNISPSGTLWAESMVALLPVVIFYLLAALSGSKTPELQFRLEMPEKLWLAFTLYSALTYVLPNILLFSGNKNIPAPVIGMIMLLEPVTGILLDVIFLHVHLTWNILAGGLIIIFANAVLILDNRRTYVK